MQISCTVTALLICIFVFAYVKASFLILFKCYRQSDYDSWGEESESDDDGDQGQYMPQPYPVQSYPPPQVLYNMSGNARKAVFGVSDQV